MKWISFFFRIEWYLDKLFGVFIFFVFIWHEAKLNKTRAIESVLPQSNCLNAFVQAILKILIDCWEQFIITKVIRYLFNNWILRTLLGYLDHRCIIFIYPLVWITHIVVFYCFESIPLKYGCKKINDLWCKLCSDIEQIKEKLQICGNIKFVENVN